MPTDRKIKAIQKVAIWTKYVHFMHIFLTLYYTKNEPRRCANTDPALTTQPNKEAVMADSIVSNSTVKEQEIWKTVPGTDGNYEISNSGKIRSWKSNGHSKKKAKSPKILTALDKYGYPKNKISINGKYKDVFVHRLVAKEFIPNPENKLCVNHINGIKTDNRVENLEWCTRKENNQHAYSTGLISNDYKREITDQQCLDIIKLSDNGVSQSKIAKKHGLNQSTISRIVNFKRRYRKFKTPKA